MVFSRDAQRRSFVRTQGASYPFHMCRALHDAADPLGTAIVYLQSCSGGVYQGDRLRIRLCAEEGAHAHVTTQAPTIIHSTDHGGASQEVLLTALPGAFLEYVPDPVILFPEARFSSTLRLRVHSGGTIVVADSFLTHDPGTLKSIFDTYSSEVTVERDDGELLARDRFRLSGNEFVARFPGVSAHYSGQGTVLAVGTYDLEPVVDVLREALDGLAGVYAGVSTLPGDCGAWIRLLAADGASLQVGMTVAWTAIRSVLTGCQPRVPRK